MDQTVSAANTTVPYLTANIDAFRKVGVNWTCALASALTGVEEAICLIFFTNHRDNLRYLKMIDTARNSLAQVPPLIVVQGADPTCRPLLTQLSISCDSLPQLFITDIEGVVSPLNIYNGHRQLDALSSYLRLLQAAAVTKFTNPTQTSNPSAALILPVQQATAYSSV